jgi:putative spermidine/putrescine transport system ATP-binding protein
MTDPARSGAEAKSRHYLDIVDVMKTYDGVRRAVDGVSLAIPKGEFVTFLGPSGSGKTTTLMMIAGFEEPSAGDILLDGRSLVSIAPHRRNIGMVFQNYALFPHMTAADNVAFPLKMRGVERREQQRRAAAALEKVGLTTMATRHPRELSGGQQQRVALARALVFEPDVLLLDEPLGALDKSLREQMQVEIKHLHDALAITTIFVTHDQTEAMTMSDRIAVFNHGRIEQFAAPLEVYAKPATQFVGGFVGDSNFFDVKVLDPVRATLDGRTLGALNAAPTALAAGTSARLMVRPESFRIVSGEDAAQAGREGPWNACTVRIEGRVNYGDSVLVLGHAGEVPIRIRLSGIDAMPLNEGDSVRVGWRGEDSCLLAS